MEKAKTLGCLIVPLFMSFISPQTMAADVWLAPSGESVSPGDTWEITAGQNEMVGIDLFIDFRDAPTVGGGVDIGFSVSDLVHFSSFSYDAGFAASPSFQSFTPKVDASTGNVTDLGFGTFDLGTFAFTGPERVGTLMFHTSPTMTGMVDLDLLTSTNPTLQSFATTADPFIIVPNLYGGTVNVVPEMEVWAMMLAGVGLLGWHAKRREQKGINAVPA